MTSRDRRGEPGCREIFALLSEYLDEELDTSICRRLEGHLEDCPECEAFLDSLRRTIRLIRSDAEGEAAPEDLRQAVIEAHRHLEG